MPMDWAALASSTLDKVGSAASFGKGMASGVGDGAVSMAEGLWSLGKGAVNVGSRLATDSAYRQAATEQTRALANSAVEYGGRLIDDPGTRTQAYEQVQNLAGSLKQQFLDARAQAERNGTLAEFYGTVAGRGGFEAATFLVPAAKLSALGKGAEAAEAAKLLNASKVADGLTAAKAGEAMTRCKLASEAAELVEVRSAEEVNAAMVAAGNLPAWKPGTQVFTEVVPAGTQFQMVVSQGQKDALAEGFSKFGGFATSETVPSQAFAREKLVVLERFKSDVSGLVTVETTAEQTIRRGLTGPLEGYAGGVQQVEFIGNRALKMVGNSLDLPVK